MNCFWKLHHGMLCHLAVLALCSLACSATAQSNTNTTTTVTSTPNPSGTGYPVAFTAFVTDGNGVGVADGSVTFVEGLATLGTVPINGTGHATFITDALALGSHTIRADYSGNTSPPLARSSAVMVHTVKEAPATNTFINSARITLPTDARVTGTPYPSTIIVSNVHRLVRRVTVTLNNISGYLGDYDILLGSPSGLASYVISDAGGSVSNATLTLADDALNSISGSPASGTYKPTNVDGPGSTGSDFFPAPAPLGRALTFSNFVGTEANGPWSLFISSDGGSGGVIAGGWTLTIETIPQSVRMWDGGADDANWSTAANWAGDVAPVPGDELIFPAGTLRTTNTNDFPNGTFFGSMTFSGSNYVVSGNSMRVGRGVLAVQAAGTNLLQQPITFQGPQSVVVTGATAMLSLNGGLGEGNGATIAKSGNGTVLFGSAVADTFLGALWIAEGQALLGHPALVTTTANPLLIDTGAVVHLLNQHQINDKVRVQVRGTGVLDLGDFTDLFNQLEMTQGTVLCGGGDLLLQGIVVHPAGESESSITGSMGTMAPSTTISNFGGTLRMTGLIHPFAAGSGITLTGLGTTIFDGPGTNTYPGATTVNGGMLVLAKNSGVAAVSGNLTIGDGLGQPGEDSVVLRAAEQITRTATVFIAASGRLDLGPNSQTIAQLIGSGLISNSAPSILTVGTGGTLENTFTGSLIGSGGLTKAGNSTLVLGGTNIFTGPTVLSNGNLVVNGPAPSTTVTVYGGTLSGGGRVNDIVARGGRVALGNSALEVGRNLALSGGAILQVNFNSALDNPLRVSGSVDLGGCVLNATLGVLIDTPAGQTRTLIDNRGGSPVAGTFAGLPEGATTMISGVPYRLSYVGGDGNDVTVTQLPFSSGSTNPIPPLGASGLYPWPINVSTVGGTIARVSVTLAGVNHTRPDDLDIVLQSPSGRTVILMSDAGGSSPLVNATLTFDDIALNLLPDNGPILSGTYRPTDYETPETLPSPAPLPPYGNTLSVFRNTDPNGTWWLWVADDTAGESGNIDSWSISFLSSSRLSISQSSQSMTIKWPAALAGYRLESAAAVIGPWQPVTNSVTVVGDEDSVTLPIEAVQFFRLNRP